MDTASARWLAFALPVWAILINPILGAVAILALFVLVMAGR